MPGRSPRTRSRASSRGYAESAERLKRAGFSGVELHGAHGYLIAQFLSPACNDRTDGYGRSFEGRTRFMREVLAAVRAACGADFIVGIKLPADERVPGGIDPDEAERIAAAAAAEGVLDYLCFSQGAFGLDFDTHLPDMHYAPRPFLPLHARLRAAGGGLPVIGLGRIESAEAAEAALAERACDMVGFSRLLVSDADWPRKVREGRAGDIRACTFCNYCWGEIHAGKPIRCFQNPMLGQAGEAGWRPPAATRRKRVVVVGAGLAGLEAAWVAAARGHAVTVFSGSDEPGGAARLEAQLPGRAEVARTAEFQHRKAAEAGAEFRFGEAATAAAVTGCAPDAAILATGSRMRRPPALAGEADAVDLRSAVAELVESDPAQSPGTAVLLDMDQTPAVYAAAELLAQRFARVVLLTPAAESARFVNLMSRMGVERRLALLGIDVRRLTEPTARAGERVTCRHVITGAETAIEEVALLTYATPRAVRDGLASEMAEAGVPVTLIGDCLLPRDAASAVHDGHRAALAL